MKFKHFIRQTTLFKSYLRLNKFKFCVCFSVNFIDKPPDNEFIK